MKLTQLWWLVHWDAVAYLSGPPQGQLKSIWLHLWLWNVHLMGDVVIVGSGTGWDTIPSMWERVLSVGGTIPSEATTCGDRRSSLLVFDNWERLVVSYEVFCDKRDSSPSSKLVMARLVCSLIRSSCCISSSSRSLGTKSISLSSSVDRTCSLSVNDCLGCFIWRTSPRVHCSSWTICLATDPQWAALTLLFELLLLLAQSTLLMWHYHVIPWSLFPVRAQQRQQIWFEGPCRVFRLDLLST